MSDIILPKLRVALVYDRVNKWGGAERVLLALHKIFPDAPLYTSVYDQKKAPWASVFNVRTSFLQNFPLAVHHELYATLMPLAFESFKFDEYDLVISVTSEAAKGIITKPGTAHICYLLTPTRYLWSGYDEYFKNPSLRLLSKPAVSYLRMWDKQAAQRPDAFISISQEVKRRAKRYYGRDSSVVYPPVTLLSQGISNFKYQISNKQKASKPKAQSSDKRYTLGTNPYFLIVSRLVPYKRIDIAVEAFNKLGLSLKIIGTGSEEARLRRLARPNVELLGYLTEEELLSYYLETECLVFPGREDLGLTILEANSFGKPVIALKAGGAEETVREGKTGIFFDAQSPEAIISAVEKFRKMKFNPNDCIERAKEFSFDIFKEQILSEIGRIVKKI